jgi:predicted nuclease of restriction endonuclease-like (RecB) superfamily
MRAFATAYPDEHFVQAVLAQIPWYHNITLVEKVKEPTARLWYAQQAITHGWSRNVLVHQIESHLYQRQGQAVSNFARTLPMPQSDLAQQLLKDPYHFDFLTLTPAAQERELERALLQHLRDFFLELGVGFALVGSQYRLEVADEEFYLDLLFYHLKLRCYIVIELKTGAFKPEYAGKMNFYLSAVDDLLRHSDDQPSIGLILCKT